MRGFTLIELVIVSGLLGIMAALAIPLVRTSLVAYDTTLGNLVVLDKLRYATERLAREIRGVQFANDGVNPAQACPGGSALVPTTCPTTSSPGGGSNKYCMSSNVSNLSNTLTATSNTLIFTRAYCAPDGTLATRDVTIGNNGSQVTLNYTANSDGYATPGAQVLTDELGATGNLVFSFFQQDGTTAATSNANVRYVQISLTLQHTVGGVTQNYTQRTRVDLRNQ